ncbi:Transcriptional regulator of acetoin/glycerol metabolism [Alteribacillus bidgolensis]|uniref:Transcriptional regulator of acetoin/glycerol metabolism n=2 Tax=Alteribacillus bidgolensis TaxID=930129 RepID=A0A1G8FX76_9BACI|nr:sigma-54-dependent Fis family transcriptional regulator [Alteribacillus bidgolensis]SDH86675.1 Transcriptional regulator of acetoin/glycerol metabolism [Alteribacillus bidgolensis]
METTLSLNTWKRFVNEGVLETSRLSNEIVKSWHRCKDSRVDPHLEKGDHILTVDHLNFQRDKNSFLLNIAGPHLKSMKQYLEKSGMIALLIDPEGYILTIIGNKDVLKRSSKINFIEGACWTEDKVGTNAIGTALQTKQPIMVTGTEHYSIASHQWSCSAAPICNDEGKIMGLIDISSPVDRAHPYMLGMVTVVANSIERELSIQMHKNELELIHSSMDLIESDKPLLICNHKKVVVAASKPVRKDIQKWAGMKKRNIPEYGYDVHMETPIYSRYHNNLIGSCVYLLKDTINKKDNSFLSKPFYFKGEPGTSNSFQLTLDKIKIVAPTNAETYIFGETGTGKEVIAQTIHENSPRKTGPFVAVNCGAIPKELMESELFGYVDGAFTGARRQGHKGKFEQANQGTLFLDEIGEIPQATQIALLRVLQERKVTPIGGNQETPLDVRIITATNRDIRKLVKEGHFREDLFYRLYVYPVHLPPLRERREDIPDLVRYFCERNEWEIKFSPKFFDKLMEYHWPGNIRELFNVLERLRILSQDGITDEYQLMKWLDSMELSSLEPDNDFEDKSSLTLREQVQKDSMIKALQKTQGNVTLAAKLLNMPRSTFYHRLQKFDL